MKITIRPETPKDYAATEEVVKEAFLKETMSDQQEHVLVQKLRTSSSFVPELSLVALNEEEKIIAHLLLTENKIVNENQEMRALSLAPVAVHPDFQSQGIGSQLIREGIKRARAAGYQAMIVLGHPTYYPRFGFKPAHLWQIKAPFDVPHEAFMALELTPDALENQTGTVQYPTEFLN